MNALNVVTELLATVPLVDFDDYLGDGGVPRGGRPVLRLFGAVTAWLILIFGAIGFIYGLIRLGEYMRDKARVSDVVKPFAATLVLFSISAILGIVSGAFNGIIGAAS